MTAHVTSHELDCEFLHQKIVRRHPDTCQNWLVLRCPTLDSDLWIAPLSTAPGPGGMWAYLGTPPVAAIKL